MSDAEPGHPSLSRRSFALGALGITAATALTAGPLGSVAAAAGRATGRGRAAAFFDEQTLWDAGTGPLANYHVHALAVLPDDTVLAVTEGRHETCDAGPRDLLLRRSTDGGDSWEADRTVVTSVDGQSWGNPTLLVDRETEETFLFFNLSERLPENTSCSGDSAELYLVSSTDAGLTWTEPRQLAGLFDNFPYDWALHGPGPGHGLQLASGRLLLNCSHRRVIVGNSVEERYYGLAPIYSDDHGATWQATGEVPVSVDYPINESRMVQLSDGTVLVNGRAAAGGEGQRIVSVSTDDGLTWSAPGLDGGTGSLNAVDASLLRYTGGPGSDEPGRILYSRPDSPVRFNMTVGISYDEGHSYQYQRVINEQRSYYSDLARLSDGTILLLYGCDGDLPSAPLRVNVCRFTLDWLTAGRDTLAGGPGYRETLIALADAAPAASDGTLSTSADPLARGTRRVVLASAAEGATLTFTFSAPRTADYQLVLRHHRSADGALTTVTVDDGALPDFAVDTTAQSADGYDLARLGTTRLTAGTHTLRCTLEGPGLGGGTRLALDSLSLVEAPAPADVRDEVVVDNDRLGFERVSGTWKAGTVDTGYWGGNYLTTPAGSGDAAARWTPVVPTAGSYEIQVSYPLATGRASNAPYTVTHAEGTTLVRVDQGTPGTADPRGGNWTSLGTYHLLPGLTTSVELTNDADNMVGADAIRILGPQ